MQRAMGSKSLECPDMRSLLQQAGFVDIRQETQPLPLNPWKPRFRNLALTYAMILASDPSYDSPSMFEGMMMAPFTRNLGWSRNDVDRLLADVLSEVHNPNYHVYHDL